MEENKTVSYKVEEIHSWDEFLAKVRGYEGWAFRGQQDSTWPLLSSLGRYLKKYVCKNCWEDQEKHILNVFQRKARLYLTNPPSWGDTFEWLALMQHFGSPTRLLDFTWSPFVAAFFALEHAEKTAAVWALNTGEGGVRNINDHYQMVISSPERISGITRQYEQFFEDEGIGFGEPFVMNERLNAQSGTFVITNNVGDPIEKVVKDCFPNRKDILVQFELPSHLVRNDGMRWLFWNNIKNATLFPDLGGLAKSMAYELEYNWRYDPRIKPEKHKEEGA
jgi:hypothetical protein